MSQAPPDEDSYVAFLNMVLRGKNKDELLKFAKEQGLPLVLDWWWSEDVPSPYLHLRVHREDTKRLVKICQYPGGVNRDYEEVRLLKEAIEDEMLAAGKELPV